MASPVIEDVDSSVVLKKEKPVEEVVDAASPESTLEGKAPPVIEETDSAIVLKEEKPVEDAINEAKESPIEDTTYPMIEEVDSSDNSPIDLEEEKPVDGTINEVCLESPMEGMVSPMIKEVYSFFVDSSVVLKKEDKPAQQFLFEHPIKAVIITLLNVCQKVSCSTPA